MTYPDGHIGVRVALSLGATDMPALLTDPAWTDLTDRVKGYRDRRGRDDVLDAFGPGTAQVVLDNGDRALDPSNTDGLLYDGADPIGLPLCPVKITQWWGGVEYPKFTGHLGPEAWPGDVAPKGPSGTTTLHVMDAVGHSPGLLPELWGLVASSFQPDWWLRMDDFEFPVLDDGSPVPNHVGPGTALVEGTTGISRARTFDDGSALYGVFDPGLLLSGDHIVRSAAADIMPDGDEDKFSVWLWWTSTSAVPAGEIARVAEMVHPITGIRRWSIYIDGDDGLAYVTTFDAAGDPVDTDTISPLVGSRWDTPGFPHSVVAVSDGATASLTVWFGGVSATLSAPAYLYESDLVLGPSPVDVGFDEVMCFRRELSYDSEIVQGFALLGFSSLWNGDTWGNRLGHFIEATGRTVTADDTNEWHLPADDTMGLWGLVRPRQPTGNTYGQGSVAVTLPKDLAEAYQITAEDGNGARWATKDGPLRFRTVHALTDATYAAHYANPVTFTDRDDPMDPLGTDEYRHAGVEVTGLRIDRIINSFAVRSVFDPDVSTTVAPDIATASPITNRKIDYESKDRFGLRHQEIEVSWADWVLNQSTADQNVERFAWPRQEIERLHLDPLGDDDLGEWLVRYCELEKACTVIYTPSGADPITVDGLNIQQIETNWSPERWSVDLVVAAS